MKLDEAQRKLSEMAQPGRMAIASWLGLFLAMAMSLFISCLIIDNLRYEMSDVIFVVLLGVMNGAVFVSVFRKVARWVFFSSFEEGNFKNISGFRKAFLKARLPGYGLAGLYVLATALYFIVAEPPAGQVSIRVFMGHMAIVVFLLGSFPGSLEALERKYRQKHQDAFEGRAP